MFKRLFLTTALALPLAATPALAQDDPVESATEAGTKQSGTMDAMQESGAGDTDLGVVTGEETAGNTTAGLNRREHLKAQAANTVQTWNERVLLLADDDLNQREVEMINTAYAAFLRAFNDFIAATSEEFPQARADWQAAQQSLAATHERFTR